MNERPNPESGWDLLNVCKWAIADMMEPETFLVSDSKAAQPQRPASCVEGLRQQWSDLDGTEDLRRKDEMFELRVTTAPEAVQLMEQGWPTRIISLVGDDLRFELPQMGSHHFISRFHDLEVDTPGYSAPTPDVLASAVEHSLGLNDNDRLLIHCHAGKSRSPAMALGVLIAAGLGPDEALTKVRKLRPFIIPNRMMVRFLDEILEQRGHLIRVVDEHYAKLPHGALLPNRGGLNV
jgi:predicted protein tyrosine phosphatase